MSCGRIQPQHSAIPGRGWEPISDLDSGNYDVVASVGAFGESHLPVKSVDDMISAAKPGGLVVIVMRKENLVIVEAYKDKLEPYLACLEERNYWTRVSRKVVPDYFCGKDGLILTYKVL
ncbi:uncharacterized protein LOC123500996 [Portunus trituberculatus]|uniref:uncharacterized protein LOC123500996 n=1 Tax=Portunus trituberculatus TaxID=210409 RepID=UPI001E1D0CDC|nr:uncharacterized protein LOC123500996 [Portunus trituberculatus]